MAASSDACTDGPNGHERPLGDRSAPQNDRMGAEVVRVNDRSKFTIPNFSQYVKLDYYFILYIFVHLCKLARSAQNGRSLDAALHTSGDLQEQTEARTG